VISIDIYKSDVYNVAVYNCFRAVAVRKKYCKDIFDDDDDDGDDYDDDNH